MSSNIPPGYGTVTPWISPAETLRYVETSLGAAMREKTR
jgi:hypothetical protein